MVLDATPIDNGALSPEGNYWIRAIAADGCKGFEEGNEPDERQGVLRYNATSTGVPTSFRDSGEAFRTKCRDEHFHKLRPQWPLLKRKPSEIIKSPQVAFTCEPEETILPYVLDDIGITQVMYASDYRHWDSEFPDSVKEVKKIPGMTEDKLRHVLGENARNWFNLKDEDLPVR